MHLQTLSLVWLTEVVAAVATAFELKKGYAISNSLNKDSEQTTTSIKEKKEEVSFEEL